MIPPGGTATFSEVSQKTGLEKNAVRRLLRHAMNMRIFREPEPEVVAHTSISKFLTIPYINGWVGFEARDTWPATTRVSVMTNQNAEKMKKPRANYIFVSFAVDCRRDSEMAEFGGG